MVLRVKRFLVFLLSVMLAVPLFVCSVCSAELESEYSKESTVFRSEVTGVYEAPPMTETPRDSSVPRLMVSSYTVENRFVTPGASAKISVVFKNMSSTKAVSNIKLSFSEDSGELYPDGLGTCYTEKIDAGGEYVWSFTLCASHTVASGEHFASISSEYEDTNGSSYSASDKLRIPVRQSVCLEYENAALPLRAIQGDTVSIAPKLMNTGKSALSNVRLSFEIEGLNSGGSAFVGSVSAGESKNANINFNVAKDKLGEVSGVMKITYEDEYGETHEVITELSTTIEEKVAESSTAKEEEKQRKNALWWLFMLAGAAPGAALGAGIPAGIRSRKQRLEDENNL